MAFNDFFRQETCQNHHLSQTSERPFGKIRRFLREWWQVRPNHDPYSWLINWELISRYSLFKWYHVKHQSREEPKRYHRRYQHNIVPSSLEVFQHKSRCCVSILTQPNYRPFYRKRTPFLRERGTWTQWVRKHCGVLALGVRREHPWVRAVEHWWTTWICIWR